MNAEIVRLEDSQIDQAGSILARAFHNDPLMTYTIPDPAERDRLLPQLYTRMLRFGVLSGEVLTTAGAIEAAAVWLPPGAKWTREKVEASGLHELSAILGEDAIARFREVNGYEAQARERDMPAQSWYLLLLGVEPAHQGRGLGGEMLRPMLKRIRAEGCACYLETEQPRNVAFYLKHGFELILDGETAGASGLRFWTFRRPPKR